MKPKSKSARRAQIGDVIEIATPNGLAYAQFSQQHARYDSLLRVLPGLFAERHHSPCELTEQGELFYVFYPVRLAVRRGFVQVVASCALPPSAETFPLMRKIAGLDRTGQPSKWVLWDGEHSRPVGELSDEEKGLSVVEFWNHQALVARIANQWRPSDEFRESRARSAEHRLRSAEPDASAIEQLAGVLAQSPKATIEHYLYFATEDAAKQAGDSIRLIGLAVKVELSPPSRWLVIAKQHVASGPSNALELRQRLEDVALKFHGDYDGWETTI